MAHAAIGLWLLVTLSTGAYVVVNAVLSVAVPAVALAVSVTWFRRTVLSLPDSTLRPVQLRACEAVPT